MIYAMTEMGYAAAQPWRTAARAARSFWGSHANPWSETGFGRQAYAAADLFANVTRRYGKPDWRIDSVDIDGKAVRVREEVEWSSPWCRLLHFARDTTDMRRAGRKGGEPHVLIVAPLSGHYATLLRGTVQAFLQDHEVYVTDWVNAREVVVSEGRFDFHDFIDHVRAMLQANSARARTRWPCASPGPPVLAAAALMSRGRRSDGRPASMTFMGSPHRRPPVAHGDLTSWPRSGPFAWFKLQHDPDHAASPYPGALRQRLSGLRPALQLHEHEQAERHQSTRTASISTIW